MENVKGNHNYTKLEISAYPETSDEFANSFSLLAFRTLLYKPNVHLILWWLVFSPEIKKYSFLGRTKISERYIMRLGFVINRMMELGGGHKTPALQSGFLKSVFSPLIMYQNVFYSVPTRTWVFLSASLKHFARSWLIVSYHWKEHDKWSQKNMATRKIIMLILEFALMCWQQKKSLKLKLQIPVIIQKIL